MKRAVIRSFTVVGKDPDFLYFTTPSWTRGGISHDVNICRRTGRVTCTCEDAMYRRKDGNIVPTGKENPCKHVQHLLRVTGAKTL